MKPWRAGVALALVVAILLWLTIVVVPKLIP